MSVAVVGWGESLTNSVGGCRLWDRHEHAKEESLKLQDIMSDMLIAFARTGNPRVEGFEY